MSLTPLTREEMIKRAQKSFNQLHKDFGRALQQKTEEELLKKERELDKVLGEPKKQFKSLGTGFHNGVLYFGTTIQNRDGKTRNAIITSDKKLYIGYGGEQDQIKEDFGLNYRFDLFDDCIDYMWSNKSIKNWLLGKYQTINLNALYQTLYTLNKKFVYHVDERIHQYIACDIISNYFVPLFDAKGRTYFQAEFASGKTRQSRVYHVTSFNSLFAANISPASFERVIESTCGTIIIDNFDNMADDLKKLILQAIEVYYKKGGKNIKADGRNNRPIAFNGYSPLVINNIIGLPDVTVSRCNKFLMLRTDKKNITDARLDETDKFYQTLRDYLHVAALQHHKIVKETYENLQVSELAGRDLEKAEAVLTIAKIIGEEIYTNILNLIRDTTEQQNIKELSDNWEFILFKSLHDLTKNSKQIRLFVKEITAVAEPKILADIDQNRTDIVRTTKLKFSHYIGKILGSIPNFKKKVSGGYVSYLINRDDLLKVIQIKGFGEYIEQEQKQDAN